GKFGGDTDNWMWPRHTGDFSVFRVYADANNKPAEYSKDNKPYQPKYVAEVSLKGYEEKDYAMTIGFPGSTDRYLCSWGVKQRIEDLNKPRIEVRGIKQEIWRNAMLASDEVRIKYASKYAGSSNYWKNSIGMNKGLANLKVIDRKKQEEAAFAAWVAKDAQRKEKYGEVLNLLEKGYTSSGEYRNLSTYLSEAFLSGAEIVRLARMVESVDVKKSTPEEIDIFLEDRVKAFFKDYEASLDQKVLGAMMKIVKERVPAEYLPDIYAKVDKKYKGDYDKYAADLFKKTALLSYDNIASIVKDPKKHAKLKKDPAVELSTSVFLSFFELQQLSGDSYYDIAKGERLYFAGLKEMYPEKALPSDANFTMRVSYGSVGGYRPYDAAWYNYYTTQKGIFEKENPESDEFWVQSEILDMIRSKNFGQYANKEGDLQLCFLSNNDITGGNSGSPVFDKNARLIGLAFDGNWEAMSGDIAFEPELQRTISVDIRYVLYIIDKWGKCSRLIDELKLVK
ncbi:MAG: S46 family peptidase, partial [Parabacteroides sp.]|nr:S46 family peptidase [Parabacteroides sp.]